MIRWLCDLFLVLIGRGVVVSKETAASISQVEVLASVLARMDPFSTSTPIHMSKSSPINKLALAVAYLSTLPSLFAKTKNLLEQVEAQQLPADLKAELVALKAELAESNATVAEYEALADQIGAAVDAADAADDKLPGADEGENTGGTSGEDSAGGSDPVNTETDPAPPVEPEPQVVDGTETPPGADPFAPGDTTPPNSPASE